MTQHNETIQSVADNASKGLLESVSDWFGDPGNALLVRLIATLVTLIASYTVIKLGARGFARSARRVARLRGLDDQQTKAAVGRTKPMQLTLAITIFAIAAITILGIWGLKTAFTGLLAGAGFAGIVIGLAAADTIGDIIAGFLIFYNHPFDLGDWVEINGVQGIVEDVALGATTLLTFDNEKVTFPNRVVEGNMIKNFSHQRKLRRRLVVGVEYGTHLGTAMKRMVELAMEHDEVYKDPEPSAVSVGFGDSSVNLELRFWVEPVRSSAIKVYTDLVHAVHDTFRREGIKIAFPHMQIVQGDAWRMSSPEGS